MSVPLIQVRFSMCVALGVGGVLKKIKILGCRDPGLKICALKDRSCPVTELEGEGITP